MIRLSRAAEQHVAGLLEHYARQGRTEAARNLIAAIDAAVLRIAPDPAAGAIAPRPYPALAREGRAWLKAGHYRVTYSLTEPPVILGVFHDAADIPGRL